MLPGLDLARDPMSTQKLRVLAEEGVVNVDYQNNSTTT